VKIKKEKSKKPEKEDDLKRCEIPRFGKKKKTEKKHKSLES